jgi:flagellar basal body-associated protein FliL
MLFFKPKKKENKTLKIALIISGCVALAAAVAVVVTKLIQKCAKKKAECCCECTEAEELLVEDAVDAEIDASEAEEALEAEVAE